MKKIFISIASITFLLIQGSFKSSVELHWYNFNEGYALAVKQKKIALIDAYTDWCGWCKKMDRDTYSQQHIIDKINENFIPIKFNPEIKGVNYVIDGKTYTGMELLNLLSNRQPSGYPTTYFVLTKQKRVMIKIGYHDPAQFSTVLDEIKKAHDEG